MARRITHSPITDTPEWRALQEHCEQARDLHLRDLFGQHPGPGKELISRSCWPPRSWLGRARPMKSHGIAFGSSAPLEDVARKFGFTPEPVVEAATEQRG